MLPRELKETGFQEAMVGPYVLRTTADIMIEAIVVVHVDGILVRA